MKVGIIGTNWGRMHVGGFRGAGAEVIGLCGVDLEKTRAVAREEGIGFATNQVAALTQEVDLVVVAGPDGLHAQHVLEVLKARRAVLCEKPLTRTAQEAEELVRAAKVSGVVCAVNFPYRALRPLVALKQWLRGWTLRHLVATVRIGFPPEPQVPEGPMLGRTGDFGGLSHVLDAALWLAESPVQLVQASLQGRPVHSAQFQLTLASGAALSVSHLSCPEPGIHGAWSLLGDDWEVGFGAGYVPARGGWCISGVRAFVSGQWNDIAPGDEPRPGEAEPWARAHVDTARMFLGAMAGDPTGNLASFEQGWAIQRVIACAMDSERLGRRVDFA